MTSALLPRIASLLPVAGGQLCRTKLFQPDYEYTNQFIDLQSFDEVAIVRVDKTTDQTSQDLFDRFVQQLQPKCFLPMTLGGQIDTIDRAAQLFDLGADRIVVGSHALPSSRLVERLAQRWGSQAIVGSLAVRWQGDTLVASRSADPQGRAYDAREVVRTLQESGVGEILINSIDRDGSLHGFDTNAIALLAPMVSVPYLIAGGAGNWGHLLSGIRELGASGVLTSNIYHLTPESIAAAKEFLSANGVRVRMPRIT